MKGIIQFGIPRSASAYTFQIIKTLFPGVPAIKIHNFIDDDRPVVATYRDPRDCMVSAWRVGMLKVTYNQLQGAPDTAVDDNSVEALEPQEIMGPESVEWYGREFVRYYDIFEKYKKSRHRMVVCRYEEFHVDDRVLFDALEQFFRISIDEARRQQMRDDFSMESNRRRASVYKGFGEYTKLDHIHGRHVFKGEIGGWRQYVSEEGQTVAHKLFRKILKSYNYPE